jgi:hypothetical protein
MNYCPACGTHYLFADICPRDGRLLWRAGSDGITVSLTKAHTVVVTPVRPTTPSQ